MALANPWYDQEFDDGVGVGGEFEGGSGGGGQHAGGGGGGGGSVDEPPDDVHIGDAGTLRGLWGGGRCVTLHEGADVSPDEEARLLNYIAEYGHCEQSEGGGGTQIVEVDPADEAMSVWLEIPLATPDPEIQPGWMVVGKPAFLEPNTSLDRIHRSTSTPAGQLELRADSHYRVDWDDRESPGERTYHVEGAPWPDGAITHLYQHAGTYDVKVEQVWRAQWRVGGGAWNDISLERERSATIPDFEVIEVQAVREH